MNKTTSNVFNANVNGTAAQSRCLCAPEVLPGNRDQLHVYVKCLTPSKAPPTPTNPECSQCRGLSWEKVFNLKVIVFCFPG